jgi:hypothetical protein
MECFTYNFTDLISFETSGEEVWINRADVPAFGNQVACQLREAVPDLSNKGMCVGIYDQDGEAVSYVPLDTMH